MLSEQTIKHRLLRIRILILIHSDDSIALQSPIEATINLQKIRFRKNSHSNKIDTIPFLYQPDPNSSFL